MFCSRRRRRIRWRRNSHCSCKSLPGSLGNSWRDDRGPRFHRSGPPRPNRGPDGPSRGLCFGKSVHFVSEVLGSLCCCGVCVGGDEHLLAQIFSLLLFFSLFFPLFFFLFSNIDVICYSCVRWEVQNSRKTGFGGSSAGK